MRKYILLICFLIACWSQSFSQRSSKGIHREIDSLLNVLPNRKDSAKIDCLNRLAIVYDWVFNDKMSWDSSYAYTLEAFSLSKRLGYKKGLAYAFIQMASEKTLDINNYLYSEKKADSVVLNGLIDSCEYYCKQAILIGEQLNNNDILGSSYWTLASLVSSKNSYEIKDKNESDHAGNYLRKALSYYEKTGDEKSLGYVYRDLFYVYQDKDDIKKADEYIEKALLHLLNAGDDKTLGDFYFFNMRGIHLKRNDFTGQEKDLKNALIYYEKAGETNNLANAYNILNSIYRQKSKLQEAEDLLKKGLSYFQKTGNEEGENSMCISLSSFYISTGDFEKGFPYCERSIKLTEKLSSENTKKQGIWGTPYFYMARLYRYAGDYETALLYLYKCKKWYDEFGPVGNATAEIGDIHRVLNNYDSAMFYLKPFDIVRRNSSTAFGIYNLGNLFIDLKEYDKAISLIKESIKVIEKTNNSQGGYNYTALAKAYLGTRNYQDALNSARVAQSLLKIEVHKIRMIDNYDVLSQIFHKLGKNDSAYYYSRQYISLKDSLLTRQFYWRLNNYKKVSEDERKTSQLNLLNKNNQLKEQKFKQEAQLKNILLLGLFALLVIGIFVFRTLTLKRKNEKLANEKTKAELQQKVSDLEMQALRAQMNPHFIFNSLNSINKFIFKNETREASDYLTRFSRLIRMVLLHSQKKLVPLEDELEMLKLYLDMERLRFKNAFDYHITTTNAVENSSVFIPPLLLQPFCENAIWHGLMHKEGPGHLNIELNEDNGILNCIITDDGVGREKAEEYKSKSAEKEKSMGLKITKERLSLLNQGTTCGTFYEIEDVKNEQGEIAGTRVELKIKYKETIEEMI